MKWCFPCGSAATECACNAGDLGSILGLGRTPGEGKGYPLQYSGLENSMDYSPCGRKELDTTEQLSQWNLWANSNSCIHPVLLTIIIMLYIRHLDVFIQHNCNFVPFDQQLPIYPTTISSWKNIRFFFFLFFFLITLLLCIQLSYIPRVSMMIQFFFFQFLTYFT